MSKPLSQSIFGEPTLLQDRYQVGPKIGQGGQGLTYRGRDLESGGTVAIKELSVELADSWKAIELFEREGRALQNLEHEAIPTYIDAFLEENEQGKTRFFLIRQFIDGETFQELIERDEVISTEATFEFIEHMLDILEYLHGLHPPVIHRDIKPSNLVLQPDGAISLIDFGAVQVISPHTTLGSTVVGTSGYIAPEQLAGRAVPASDLYSLGATVVHLLTHIHPNLLPMERMRLKFEEQISAPPRLLRFLQGVLEPVAEDRIATVQEARAVLRGDASTRLAIIESGPLQVLHKPAGSKIKIQETPDRLSIWIPPSSRFRRYYWAAVLSALVIMVSLLPLVTSQYAPWIIGAFVALALIGQMFISPTRLELGPEKFVLNRHTLNGKHRGWTQDLVDVEERRSGEEKILLLLPAPSHLVLFEGVYSYPFGFGLTAMERRWLKGVLRKHLESR